MYAGLTLLKGKIASVEDNKDGSYNVTVCTQGKKLVSGKLTVWNTVSYGKRIQSGDLTLREDD